MPLGVGVDHHAAEPERSTDASDLLGGSLRILRGDGAKPSEAGGRALDDLGQRIVEIPSHRDGGPSIERVARRVG
jgi:hypothetical protein